MQALDINSTMKNAEKVDVTLSATSKTLKAWENKTNQRALKAGGGLTLALTLAACGGSDTVVEAEETTPVDTTPAVDPVLSVALTDGLDIIDSGNDNIFGGEATLTSGDRIETTGYVELDLSAVDIDGQTIIADNVIVDASGGVSVDASDWTVDNVTVQDSTGDVTIDDIQSAATALHADDVVDAAATVTYNFDAQAVAGTADNVSLTVSEVTSTVAVTGGNVETLTVNIADVSTDAESTLADLTATGNTSLVITGGTDTFDFTVTDELDAALTTVDGSAALSDLNLDMGESTTTMTVSGGAGADVLDMGNTLGDADEQDTLDGNGGADQMTALFSDAGTRNPISTEIETYNLTFNDDATLDFSDVDDVATINIAESSNRVELIDMDATVTTINVADTQAGDWDVDYELNESATLTVNWDNNSNATDTVTSITFDEVKELTWNHEGDDDLVVQGMVVDANHSASGTINDSLESLTDLAFNVNDNGDLTIGTAEVQTITVGTGAGASTDVITVTVGDTNFAYTASGVETATVVATGVAALINADDRFTATANAGEITVTGAVGAEFALATTATTGASATIAATVAAGTDGVDLDSTDSVENFTVTTASGDFTMGDMSDVESLERFVVSTDRGSVLMGNIGDLAQSAGIDANGDEAGQLEYVSITTNDGTVTIGDMDALSATVSQFLITTGDDADSNVTIDDIRAEDISEMTISVQQDAEVNLGTITLVTEGDTLTTSGEGAVDDLIFGDESFSVMTFGHTNDQGATTTTNARTGVHLDMRSAANDTEITGTALVDEIIGGTGRITAELGAGNDIVDMATSDGALTVDAGAGIDSITLNNAGSDADVVQMGGTAVASVTGGYDEAAEFAAEVDTIANFNSNDDTVAFTSTSAAGSATNYSETDGGATGATVDDMAAALAVADNALDGTIIYHMVFDLDGGGANEDVGLLFYDADADGSADLVMNIAGIAAAGDFDQGDIIAGADIIA